MRLLVSLGMMIALGGAAAASETRLSEGVSLAQGSFNTGGGMTVAAELRRTSTGGTALCGVWAESESQAAYTAGEARRVLDHASVSVGGRRIAQDLGFLPKIAPRLDYAGAPARCRLVDLPWRAGLVPEVFLPRRVIQPGNRDTGNNLVRFDPTGAGAMADALDLVPLVRRHIGLVPLSPAARVVEGRYSSGGGLRLAAEIVSVNGRAALCGVWSDLPGQVPQTEPLGRAVLREAVVTLGGRALSVDPGALRRVSARGDYTGAAANCLDTGLRWMPALGHVQSGIALPNIVVHRNTTPRGAQVIRFAPRG
ncbi:orotidine 5-phosphate decarboxylase [Roseovarius autotrophicus]|uniref:orotidine 5-phosphate decarboxylase n=1 Tax=Roseovarius autotrophicus TaxID=2824121 RepID=UPI0019FC270E|nr:orotidine 5-phosphate decarboxylase [Roseovarius autotrophicus]MBE0453556.1 orotidine 5-phosphate decarboxylase [Roseovarius sp.]